jgi:acetyl esterase/lipase
MDEGTRRRSGGFSGARAGAVGAIAVALLALVPDAAVPVAGAHPSAATAPVQDAGGDATAVGVPSGGRYLEPVFEDVDVTRDVAYRDTVTATGDPVTLRLDVYEPAGDTAERRPVVLLAYGGAFAYGDKTDAWGGGPQVAEPFARLGYVVVSIQYRIRYPGCYWIPEVDQEDCELAALDAYDDAFAAVAWVRDHATEYRLDPDTIVPAGWSAGGVLAWALAWFQGSADRPEPSGIAAAVSYAGVPFADQATGELPRAPRPDDPPVIAFHGTADRVLQFEDAERPCLEAAASGATCELVAFPGVGHPLDDPINGLDRHAEQIFERTVEFLAEQALLPRGYFDVDEPQPPSPPPPPPTVTPGNDPSPGDPNPVASAPPAQPVVGQPDYTG